MFKEIKLFFEDEPWGPQSVCRKLPTSKLNRLFFGDHGDSGEENREVNEAAKVFCRRCPVKEPCLQKAITTGDIYVGVRGEKSPGQLQSLRAKHRKDTGDHSQQKSPSSTRLNEAKRSRRG